MKIKITSERNFEIRGTAGTEKENNVVIMEFEFPEEIQDYVKYIEFEIDENNKVFDLIQNDKYTLTSAITKYQEVKAQVVAKKDTDVWKSKMFELKFNKSVNADHEIEDEEQIDILNTVIERVQAIEDDIEELNEKIEHIEIGGYDDTEVRELIQENTDSINNLETIKQDKLVAGANITIENNVISSTGGGSGGTSDYSDLDNKPSINNVELVGNKSLNDLGIQPKGNYVVDNNYVHTDNNFTTEEKNKLSGLSNYDDTEIKQDISDLDTNKADISEIPDVSNFITNAVNNLLNYYLKSETYTKQEVNNLLGQISTLQFQVVNELPQTGNSKYIYLVPSTNPKTKNVKDEYIWTNNTWEQIGSTQVDLTGYATESWVDSQISNFLTSSQIQDLITRSLTNYYNKSQVDSALGNKVDKETGKVLSTNDFTNIYKSNVDSNTSARHTHSNKTVLDGISSTDVANWNNKSNFSGSYNDLTNKPTIPSEVTESTVSSWGFTKNTGTYSKPSGGIPKIDLANDVQLSLGKANTAIQSHQDISGKQDTTDNTLTTTNKTIPSAINEVNSIAKGANQALSFSNYSTMITVFNSLANNIYNVGQNVMIVTLEVLDLWISGIESTSQAYTYTTDEAFTTALNTNGYLQVGYYKLSALETQKVDLTDYATKNYVDNLFNSIIDGDEVSY